MKPFDLNSVDTSNTISCFLHRADYMKSHGIPSDDFSKPNLIYLDQPVKTNYIKFKILDIYPGERFDDTCISEINVY